VTRFLGEVECPNTLKNRSESTLTSFGNGKVEPEGKAEEFWHQAKSELESDAPGDEDPSPDGEDPKPMPE
jgi:hypothetical protein